MGKAEILPSPFLISAFKEKTMIDDELYYKFSMKKIFVPLNIINETHLYLRSHGKMGHEGMVLWSGTKLGSEATVKTCIHPAQKCTAVSYDIPLEESQTINRILAEKSEVIIAQVHSHPGAAFHSSRDDAMPFTYSIGFLSLVVPNFCDQQLLNLSDVRIWEHTGSGNWSELSKTDINDRLILRKPEVVR